MPIETHYSGADGALPVGTPTDPSHPNPEIHGEMSPMLAEQLKASDASNPPAPLAIPTPAEPAGAVASVPKPITDGPISLIAPMTPSHGTPPVPPAPVPGRTFIVMSERTFIVMSDQIGNYRKGDEFTAADFLAIPGHTLADLNRLLSLKPVALMEVKPPAEEKK